MGLRRNKQKVLLALIGTRQFDGDRQAGRYTVDGEELVRVTDLSEDEVMDALTLARDGGLIEWHRGLGQPLGQVTLTPQGRLEAESLVDDSSRDRGEASTQGRGVALAPPARSKRTVLFLAANPESSARLALDEEAREIHQKIRASDHRETLDLTTRWAVRPDDLQQALLETKPTIVHFSGHGTGQRGIVLHGAERKSAFVRGDALRHLFEALRDDISVVVLNACFSEEQAQEIVSAIDVVVGMSDSVGDEAARVFAASFYRGLGFGRSVRVAFDLGVSALKLAGHTGDEDVPRLLTRAGVDANQIFVTPPDVDTTGSEARQPARRVPLSPIARLTGMWINVFQFKGDPPQKEDVRIDAHGNYFKREQHLFVVHATERQERKLTLTKSIPHTSTVRGVEHLEFSEDSEWLDGEGQETCNRVMYTRVHGGPFVSASMDSLGRGALARRWESRGFKLVWPSEARAESLVMDGKDGKVYLWVEDRASDGTWRRFRAGPNVLLARFDGG